MSTFYDLVADKYDLSFQLIPLRLHSEAFSVLRMVSEVEGLSVLDVACGTGFYARALRKHGASRVLGIDLSPEMIRVAAAAEQAENLGIEVLVGDAITLEVHGQFDLALGVYLLHYAGSREALAAMCRGIARNLKPGGRFVGFILNPDLKNEVDGYPAYGLQLRIPDPGPDGCPMHLSIQVPGLTSPEFTGYRWSKDTVEHALAAAGLRVLRWQAPEVSPAGLEKYGAEYWHTYLAMPHCVLIDCLKL